VALGKDRKEKQLVTKKTYTSVDRQGAAQKLDSFDLTLLPTTPRPRRKIQEGLCILIVRKTKGWL